MEFAMEQGFCEMEMDEMDSVNGGFVSEVVLGAKVAAKAVGAVCGLGPVGGAVVIVAGVAALGVGIYAGLQ